MPAHKPVKECDIRLVGVIMTSADLRLAGQMSAPPDLFELRLDSLLPGKGFEQKARALNAPLIITARHPIEGGKNNLPAGARRDLLLQFLPLAQYVDVELRSIRALRQVLERAKRSGVGVIISFHDLRTTPQLGSLRAKAQRVAKLGPAVFKVATRTDTAVQLSRLMQFVSVAPPGLPWSVMGMGKLGAPARIALARLGSRLVYASLARAQVEGQLGLEELRRALQL